jgi:tetratricopeptide (TPR) repeat protein
MHTAQLAVILSWALSFTVQAAPIQASVDAYIAAYGAIAPEQDPHVATAYRVFAKVKAAADKSIRRMPKLVVIAGATDAWAIALPSGHIVLSRKGLELCFKDADQATAETRLAFILGHELAHLAHDDYWHHEVESFLAKTPDTQKIAHFLDQSFAARQVELVADDKGYLYAAMAGYPVNRLVDERTTDFFTFWMQQTQAKISSSHPFPEDRAALLRERLKMLQEKLALFEMGVRLAHFGRCADGVYFLQEFKQVFPEPAVLNDLGVCSLFLAQQKMTEAQANFYWLPFLLEIETRAKTRAVVPESPCQSLKTFDTSPQVQSHLKEAAEYLEQAVAAAPDDLTARLNLATVLLYQGRPHQARAVLSEALQFAPEDWQVKMLDALALYEQSEADIDLWPAAVKKLEAFPEDMPPAWRYNLARLLELRPRPQEAQVQWNLLAQTAAQLPPPVRQVVCAKQSLKPPAACLNPQPKEAALPLPWRWPVADHQATAPLTPSLRAKLFPGWEAIPFDYFQAKLYGFIHRSPDRRVAVLEMDQFVQLQVVKQFTLSLEQLPRFCSHPLLRHRLLGGELFTCDHWAVLTRDGQATEAWWIAP